jgi:hypothetical protein
VMRPPPTPDVEVLNLHEPDRVPADLGDPAELGLYLNGEPVQLPQLAKLRRLKKLTINSGDLASAFANLATAAKLTTLVIRGWNEAIPEELGRLENLEDLDIQSDQLATLPQALGTLAKLKSLEIGECRVAAFPGLGNLTALTHLKLWLGKVTELTALGKLAQLETLELYDASKLASLPASLVRCTKLATVKIGNPDKLANIELLGKLPALRELEIGAKGRRLPKLIDALGGTAIEKLSIDCHTAAIPASIGKLRALRELEISYGSFSTVPASLRELTQLREITLPFYRLDRNIKAMFPPGRWKKSKWAGHERYSRTD